MTIKLKENERLDELQRNGYQIIQSPHRFCFGMDAVAGFAVRDHNTCYSSAFYQKFLCCRTHAQVVFALDICR